MTEMKPQNSPEKTKTTTWKGKGQNNRKTKTTQKSTDKEEDPGMRRLSSRGAGEGQPAARMVMRRLRSQS